MRLMTIIAVLTVATLTSDAVTHRDDQASITSPFWHPTAEEQSEALTLCKTFIFQYLSDQKPPSDDLIVSVETNDIGFNIQLPTVAVPNDFSILKIRYTQYKQHFLGTYRNNRKMLCVTYFDPEAFPDWEEHPPCVLGGFPRYFVITIDFETKIVVEHYAESM